MQCAAIVGPAMICYLKKLMVMRLGILISLHFAVFISDLSFSKERLGEEILM